MLGLDLYHNIYHQPYRERLRPAMSLSEEKHIDRIYIECLLNLLDTKARETIVLWSQGYKPYEIAVIISEKYEKRLIKPNTIALRISKILKQLRQISIEHTQITDKKGLNSKNNNGTT